MTPKSLQRRLRIVTLMLAALGAAYLWNRYELIDLPGSGCSPLRSIRPGNTLWVDLAPSDIAEGNVLFFELPNGSIALAQVTRVGPEGYWVSCDDPACPGVDSDDLGWLQEEQIHGRMIMALDF